MKIQLCKIRGACLFAAALVLCFAGCSDDGGFFDDIDPYAPLGSYQNPYILIDGEWADGSFNGGGEIWCGFNVSAGNVYYVWWNDSYSGDGTKTCDIKVSVYWASGAPTNTQGADSGYSQSARKAFGPSSSGYMRIKIEPYHSSGSGTFGIVYSSTDTRPSASGSGGDNETDNGGGDDETDNGNSINIAPSPGCTIKVTNIESNINYNDYNSVLSMASINSAIPGSTIYVVIIPTSNANRIKLFPLTITGVFDANIYYHSRFYNTYGPIEGAIYRITMPSQDITISAEPAIAPVTVNGTVSLAITSGALGAGENDGLSIDFMVDSIPGSSIAGSHVPNALNTTANWSIQCIPDITYNIQGRVRMSDDEWLMKTIGTITLDSGGNVISGSTELSAAFP